MYIVTGSTSNTGSVVAHQLLDAGKKVRVIGRSLEKMAPFLNRGAEAFVAGPTDAQALIQAFKGAKAAWIMLQPNYIADSADFTGYQAQVTDAIAQAITANPLEYAVTLSSWGADLESGSGPVLGLHQMEQVMNTLSIQNLLHLRAGYFMENTLSYLPSILKNGKVSGPFDQNILLPFIATKDVGYMAAKALINLTFKGKLVQELHGQRDLSIREATAMIGNAIGKPGLVYQQNTIQGFKSDLIAAGFSANVVALMEEVVIGINSKHITTSQKRTIASTTSTSFENFLEESFVPAYDRLQE
ncbi:epimerase [Pedobacter cryoconitis]|uniref:Epimerase n=1 Tax=Pedobacter cryoconitis TaxID=188932 RepID=A0A127VCZ0_9SPHI|nr:NmrA family NAD(P)-binding protein [Pedobacter cryoconitis]AMP99091.1 epimerase [Pedobacter cryoconitis]